MPTVRLRHSVNWHSVNLSLLALLVLLTAIATVLYTSSERNFHWWIDWYYKTIEVSRAFRQSPIVGISNILQSLGAERNKIYTLPLVPFILLFGESRSVYQIGLALVYLLPFSLVMGGLGTRLISANSIAVFWLTTIFSLLIPVNWIPTFLGIPDTGGAVLIGLAVWIYLQDMRLKRWWRVPAIGVLLGLAILFRRHFTYGAIAVLVAMSLQASIFFWTAKRIKPQIAWQKLRQVAVKIGLIAIICFFTIAAIAWQFTYNALVTDYRGLYASWGFPINTIVELYAAYFGWATLILAALGFLAGILTRTLYLPAFSFIWLFGVVSTVEWLILLRYANVFYCLHLTPIVVLGLASGVWTACLRLKGYFRYLALGIVVCYLASNLAIALTPIGNFQHSLRSLWALNIPPLVRADYDEVIRLVAYLRQIATTKKPIYIVGFQRLQLNSGMVRAVERSVYKQTDRDNLLLLGVPQVDSQDFYPVERLLQAEYVVIPHPLPNFESNFTKVPVVGEWLPLKEHDVVTVVSDAFRQNWAIARDFQLLPVKFRIADGTVVSIYRRLRPTSIKTAIHTLAIMQQKIGQRPGGQLDWMSLSHLWQDNKVTKNITRTYRLLTYAVRERGIQPISFLYLGTLTNRTQVTGKVTLFGKTCNGATLTIEMRDRQGQLLSAIASPSITSKSRKFQVSLASQNSESTYLLLNVQMSDKNDLIKSCIVEIDSLKVS
ncbi:MAG: hypothetical protein N4J56_004034 [Chroococcidiopsis sp. SAG 2025]|uniref:hypothetical protein n=1 Tax=Chroococcidiopsis sp. SAG 2025 TaxID=171389 RepID=UPI00293746D5|nr:hypothetical protein [Chroococcidiopsis sp. SAG 2025]MDV2994380.1 hypothetical protein [Chroococcidiopsis sp. SAG 2025]